MMLKRYTLSYGCQNPKLFVAKGYGRCHLGNCRAHIQSAQMLHYLWCLPALLELLWTDLDRLTKCVQQEQGGKEQGDNEQRGKKQSGKEQGDKSRVAPCHLGPYHAAACHPDPYQPGSSMPWTLMHCHTVS